MTIHTRTLTLAEGAAIDARGQAALVGIEPQAWIPAGFPADVTFALVMVAEADEYDDPMLGTGSGKVTATVASPDGKVLFFWEHVAQMKANPDLGLLPRMQVVLNVTVAVERSGAHQIAVVWKPDGAADQITWTREIQVREPPTTKRA